MKLELSIVYYAYAHSPLYVYDVLHLAIEKSLTSFLNEKNGLQHHPPLSRAEVIMLYAGTIFSIMHVIKC